MKCLVIGYGSIGQRHVEILKSAGDEVITCSQHIPVGNGNFHQVKDALQSVNYVTIANATSKHLSSLLELRSLGFLGPVLVEKPLFSELNNEPCSHEKVWVAYQLRFHPGLIELRSRLKEDEVVSVNIYVGQDLSKWRTNRPYSESYSAKKSLGGGALRDLSHELDYSNWLFGAWKKVVAHGGNFSDLDIDTDDVYSMIVQTELCPILTIELNYLDRTTQRRMTINGKRHTYVFDFVKSELMIDSEIKKYQIDRNDLYRAQHKSLLKGEGETQACTFAEGREVVRYIEAIEQSAKEQKWIVL